MTREPDRYDKQGDELACAYRTDRCPDLATHARQIAAALRAEHDGAVEQTAEWIRENAHRLLSGDELAEAILKRICPRDLQEDCSAPDGEIARCMDLTCPMKSPAAAPAADLRAEYERSLSMPIDGGKQAIERIDAVLAKHAPAAETCPEPPPGLIETLEKVHGMGCGNIATQRIPIPPSEPAARLGVCAFSAIHHETPHYLEAGTCVDWTPSEPVAPAFEANEIVYRCEHAGHQVSACTICLPLAFLATLEAAAGAMCWRCKADPHHRDLENCTASPIRALSHRAVLADGGESALGKEPPR